jgi:hypothetical protein
MLAKFAREELEAEEELEAVRATGRQRGPSFRQVAGVLSSRRCLV